MARYIDADLLLSCPVRIQGHINLNNGKAQNFEAISIKEIENAPTANVVPVVHGAWAEYTTSAYVGGKVEFADKKYFRCERCMKGSVIKSNFCPNCGARMGGEGK